MGAAVLGSLASALIYSPLGWRAAFAVIALVVVAEGLAALWFIRTPPPSVRALEPKRDRIGVSPPASRVVREPLRRAASARRTGSAARSGASCSMRSASTKPWCCCRFSRSPPLRRWRCRIGWVRRSSLRVRCLPKGCSTACSLLSTPRICARRSGRTTLPPTRASAPWSSLRSTSCSPWRQPGCSRRRAATAGSSPRCRCRCGVACRRRPVQARERAYGGALGGDGQVGHGLERAMDHEGGRFGGR